MMIWSFILTIFLYQRYKFFDAEIIISLGILTPVACGFFTHEIHSDNRFHDFILDNGKCLSFLFPRSTSNLFKSLLKFCKFTFVIQLAFKFCEIRNRTTISLHFIEYFHKHFHDCLLTGANLCRAFGINIKEHDIRRNRSGIGHLGDQHRIFDLFPIRKIRNGSLSFYHTVF